MIKLKNNGFTLVELIVSIAILGLISAMSVPTLNAVQSQMEKKQFVSYGDALVSSAKIYTDSNYEDMFASGDIAQITYKDMNDKGLVKDIGIDNTTCNTDDTYVTVVKKGSSYVYCLTMNCKNKSGTTTVYSNDNSEFGSTTGVCKDVKSYKVNYKCDKNSDKINKTLTVLGGKDYYVNFGVCTKENYELSSFSTSDGNTINRGGSITISNDVTLTANWKKLIYVNLYPNGTSYNGGNAINATIKCDVDGSNCSSNSSLVNVTCSDSNHCNVSLANAVVSGWNFKGWAKSSSEKDVNKIGNSFSIGNSLTSNFYLRADKTLTANYYYSGNISGCTGYCDLSAFGNSDDNTSCSIWNNDSSCTVTLPNLSKTLKLGIDFGRYTAENCDLKDKRIKMRNLFDYSWYGSYTEKVNDYTFKINSNTNFYLNLSPKSSYLNKKLYVCSNTENLWLRNTPNSQLKAACTVADKNNDAAHCGSVNNIKAYIIQNDKGKGYFVWTGAWSIDYGDYGNSKDIMFYGYGYYFHICNNYNHTGANCSPGGVKTEYSKTTRNGWGWSIMLYK